MTNCVDTIKSNRHKITAAIHPYDQTCRPQILFKDDNPFFYNLINNFGKKSGTFALLNTSLNVNEPICENPENALEIFTKTSMDAIVIQNWILTKK